MRQGETIVDFAGEIHRLSPAEDLVFGRGSEPDLDVGSNPLLHRRFGRIFYRDGIWWLRNEGSRLSMRLHDRTSPSAVTLAPGREVSVSFPEAAIRFEAGSSNYEILLDTDGLDDIGPAEDFLIEENTEGRTIDMSQIPLVGEQRLLLVALAESKLKNPTRPISLPTNKSVALRFGWSTTTFNRKLDRLCQKFTRAGVSGLVGDSAGVASDRRRRLVEHAINTGIITLVDLDLLDEGAS